MASLDLPKPLHLLTTLGTGEYKPVRYGWNGRTFETLYVQEALVEWLRPRRCIVLLTDRAREGVHWPALQSRLVNACELVPLAIPNGASEEELWQIFESICGAIEPDCRHVIDVTHGFRSLPVIALLSALFLRSSGQIDVESVVYGAKDDTRTDGITPIFDLSMFLNLMDWTNAVQQFVRTGDLRHMAGLIDDEQREHGGPPGPPRAGHPVRLGKIAVLLEGLSKALLANHPHEVVRRSRNLTDLFANASAEIDQWAKPFFRLLDTIRSEFGGLAGPELDAHRLLIKWYARRGFVVQALTMAREWVVSAVCQRAGLEILLQRNRKAAEAALRGICPGRPDDDGGGQQRNNSEQERLIGLLAAAFNEDTAYRDAAAAAWNAIPSPRNTVAHCAMQDNAEPVASLNQRVEQCVSLVDDLAGVIALSRDGAMSEAGTSPYHGAKQN